MNSNDMIERSDFAEKEKVCTHCGRERFSPLPAETIKKTTHDLSGKRLTIAEIPNTQCDSCGEWFHFISNPTPRGQR